MLTQHAVYAEMMKKVLSVFMDPARVQGQSTAEQIAEVVEAFRRSIGQMFQG